MNTSVNMADRAEVERVERIRNFFDQPENYLDRRRFDIRVRAETAAAFLSGRKFTRILDIGCGDGSISIPLLSDERHLTLMDISPNMLSEARSRVPANLAQNVSTVNADILTTELGNGLYDVVICVGVLAHVLSPSDVIAKISTLLRPGGTLILEFTDSLHFLRRLLSGYQTVIDLCRSPSHKVTPLSTAKVSEMTSNCGFEWTAEFCYSFPWPGTHRICSQETLYRVTRKIFGDASDNRNLWLGSEHICRLTRR